MAKYLLLLAIFLTNNSFAELCRWSGNKLIGDCNVCVPGAFFIDYQKQYCSGFIGSTAPSCTPSSETQLRPCGANQVGSETWKKDITCPTSGQRDTGWYKESSTCKPALPTCIQSTETRTISCQTGYVGQIAQQQTSSCPDPYGKPIWLNMWQTTSNSCVKAIANIASPTSVTFVNVIQTVPATVPIMSVPTIQSPTDTREVLTPTTPAPSQGVSASVQSVGIGVKAALTVQRLNNIGVLPKQPTIIETLSFSQEIPDGIRRQQELLNQLIIADDSWLDRDLPPSYRWSSVFGD